MPISNLNNTHLTAEQQTAVKTAITALETALAPLTIALTPDERSKYGSINEQNKLLVNKTNDYYNAQPELSDTSVDWTEFSSDFKSRGFSEDMINRLDACIQKLMNSKILHDYDNFQTALQDYAFTAFMAGRGNADYEAKYDEMKQFFPRKKSSSGSEE